MAARRETVPSECMQDGSHKSVLLQKSSYLGSEAAVDSDSQDTASAELALSAAPDKLAQTVHWKQGQSAFKEVHWLKRKLVGMQTQEMDHTKPQNLAQDIPIGPGASSDFSVWPSRNHGEQRSAFSKPAKSPAGRTRLTSVFQAGRPADALGELLGLINTVDLPCWGRLSNSMLLVGDIWNLQTLHQNVPLYTNPFLGAPTLWLKNITTQTPTPSLSTSTTASWALLPPTFTSLSLSTQNWCAKCNLSFRLTTDLVLHMRSHHKKEQVRPNLYSTKLRGEALSCPMCHEYFQERHHLSRHMTSHS
ncbi:zinc finger protein 488 [Erinaceus europaeus]|uniref:Zinc finger protein 488 n=1 Tax=Erinaceus europaeus TaxID=9365 RepID=A0ABM3XDM7_ERIEU|nr:zinc finger protein 488 [Erinaceus europaeus]